MSERDSVQRAVEEIGQIVLAELPKDRGFIFRADLVREVLQNLIAEHAKEQSAADIGSIEGEVYPDRGNPPRNWGEKDAREWCDQNRKHPVIGKAIQGAQSWQPDGLATIVAYIFNLRAEHAKEQSSPDARELELD